MHPSRRPAIYSRGPGNIFQPVYYFRSLDPASSSRDDDERKNLHLQGRAVYTNIIVYFK